MLGKLSWLSIPGSSQTSRAGPSLRQGWTAQSASLNINQGIRVIRQPDQKPGPDYMP